MKKTIEKVEEKKDESVVTFKIRITLIEEMLGSKPADPEVFKKYVASKHPSGTPQRDELDKAESREETGTTVFLKDGSDFVLEDYVIKGFFKEACGSLRNADDTRSKDLKAYKSRIDGLIFTYPRFFVAKIPDGKGVGVCERSLRAETMQGPRTTLRRSETLPIGTTFEVQIDSLNKSYIPLIKEWLNYGRRRGLGGWRNSGKGRFSWQEMV